jgi:hypothetical protein
MAQIFEEYGGTGHRPYVYSVYNPHVPVHAGEVSRKTAKTLKYARNVVCGARQLYVSVYWRGA